MGVVMMFEPCGPVRVHVCVRGRVCTCVTKRTHHTVKVIGVSTRPARAYILPKDFGLSLSLAMFFLASWWDSWWDYSGALAVCCVGLHGQNLHISAHTETEINYAFRPGDRSQRSPSPIRDSTVDCLLLSRPSGL